MSAKVDPTAPAIGLSVTHTVAEDRNIVAQCFVPFDCEPAELNNALDKLFAASSRQKAKVRLPQALKDLARLQKAYERANEDLVRLDAEAHEAAKAIDYAAQISGRRGAIKPSAQDLARAERNKIDRENAVTAIKRGLRDIDDLKIEIDALRVEIGGSD